MKSNPLLLVATLIIICLISCNKYDAKGNQIKDYDEIQKAKWLIGEWEQVDSLGTLQEIWTIKDDSTYTGQSYYIQNDKDTIHDEQIELTQDKEHLIYNTVVDGENNDESISFQMMKDEDSLLIFENPKHNYPEKIEYQFKKNNLIATISGKLKGKFATKSYTFKRKK